MKKIPMLERFAAQSLVDYEGELIFSKEKFAELIVRECMQVVHNGINNATDWDSSSWDQCCENRMYAIQKHFGVEDRAVPILSADEQALFAGIASSKLFTIAGAKKHFGVEE